MTNRIQILAAITGNHAAVDITRQKGRGAKETITYLAKVDGREVIEIADEHQIELSVQTLIRKVIREAIGETSTNDPLRHYTQVSNANATNVDK